MFLSDSYREKFYKAIKERVDNDMTYKLSKDERETIILFNEAEASATVYTCSTQVKNRLKELSVKSSEIYREKSDKLSETYIIPKKIIKFSLPRKLSEKQKRERALKLQENIEKHNAQACDGKGVI